jgi:hypothetical protein
MHLHTDVPIALVGGAHGRMKGGRHLRYKDLPLTNLHLAMMDIAGVPDNGYISPLSDATGKLEGLTA